MVQRNAVLAFKQRTERKLEGVRCPDHHQPPRLQFQGATLRDISIRMSACCAKLADLANRAIADKYAPHSVD